jgi:aminoglycoside 2'-N-acetyltransferase I
VGQCARVATRELSVDGLRELRRLLDESFACFDDDDWAHSLGGVHLIVGEAGAPVSHAAVIERVLKVDGRPLRAGYVEAVCTAPAHRRRGHASAVMREAGVVIRTSYELGALSTGLLAFYARFGWESWAGSTYVCSAAGPRRTPEDDRAIMILRTPATGPLDLRAGLCCEWRPGSVW